MNHVWKSPLFCYWKQSGYEKNTSDDVLFLGYVFTWFIYLYHIGWKHHQNDEVFLGRGEL